MKNSKLTKKICYNQQIYPNNFKILGISCFLLLFCYFAKLFFSTIEEQNFSKIPKRIEQNQFKYHTLIGTIQLTSTTQVVPVIVELQTFKNQTNHVKLQMDKMMIKGLMIDEDSFVIKTFGFKVDHDLKVMNNIANMKGGSFTFIDNITKTSEYFILSMSGMLSVLAKDVELQVEENPKYKIQKIFGDDFLWKKLQSGGYSMTISYLQEKDSKEFAFLLEIPSNEKTNFQTDLVVFARVLGILIEFNQDFQKQTELKLNFTLNKAQYDPIEIVEVTYLRAKSGEIIGEVKQMGLIRNCDQAQSIQIKLQMKQGIQYLRNYKD